VEERVRRGVGRSFQINNLLWRLPAAENVRCAVLGRTGAWRDAFRFPDGAVEDETRALLAAVGLADAAGVPAASLPYADQRALEIALALATRPAVLILDEPTAGMGRDDSARIVALVRRLKAEQTVILIEHDLDVVFGLADRISVLVAGRVLATGAPAAVRADPRVREAYFGRHAHA
jgi:branched-chain amino acid transport system ATP-binding protein